MQYTKAVTFRALHNPAKILVLPNAWDVVSAQLFAQAGFQAIGTTSAGIAASLGYSEPERIPREKMLGVIHRIADVVKLPVNADIEAGYAVDANGVADTVTKIISAGAVGINLEDSPGLKNKPLQEIAAQVERLQAARDVASSSNIPIVINARTDGYLFNLGNPDDRFAQTIQRANAYLEAGADCVFIPGIRDATIISRLVKEIQGPINILAGDHVPNIAALQQLGVARVSVGSGPMRATLALVRHIAKELLEKGTYSAFTTDAISYNEVNQFFI
jgi:2-methylisocitrate lyase-like PEP mutase family enzyme